MRVSRFRIGVVLACVLVVAGIATADLAWAQSVSRRYQLFHWHARLFGQPFEVFALGAG